MLSESRFLASQLSDYQCSFDEDIIVEEETPRQMMARDLAGLPQFEGLSVGSPSNHVWLPITKKVLKSQMKKPHLLPRPTLYGYRSISVKGNTRVHQVRAVHERMRSKSDAKACKPLPGKKARRKSDHIMKSSKQQRLDEMFVESHIQQHIEESKKQTTKKRTIFKRMSSILMKHKIQVNSQKKKGTIVNPLQLLNQIKKEALEQNAQNPGSDFEIQILTPDYLETKKNLALLQERLKKLAKSPSKFRKTSERTTTQQYQLLLQKRCHRTNASIQQYVQEKSATALNRTAMKTCAHTAQTSSEIRQLSRKMLLAQNQGLKSFQNLPDLRTNSESRNSLKGEHLKTVYLSGQFSKPKLLKNAVIDNRFY